jgi:tRNA threonylcarbamoyladenosine biosynthesis protein TsaB
MIIAALDTSQGVSFALTRLSSDGVEELVTVTLDETRGALQKLPEIVNKGLSDVSLSLDQIDRWVIGVGPGSFTGIRVGIAFVKGICLSSAKPYMGVSTTLALARQAKILYPDLNSFAVCFDGRRQELICSPVIERDGDLVVQEARVVKQPGFEQLVKANEAVVTLHGEVVQELLPSSRVIVLEGVNAAHLVSTKLMTEFASEVATMNASCEPIYVRPAVFTNPLFIRTI